MGRVLRLTDLSLAVVGGVVLALGIPSCADDAGLTNVIDSTDAGAVQDVADTAPAAGEAADLAASEATMDLVGTDGERANDVPAIVDNCGPDKARCSVPGCPVNLCIAPSHVPANFGTWARDPRLTDVTLPIFWMGNYLDASSGEAGEAGRSHRPSWRGPNINALAYEVVDGIGFIRVPQGPGEPEIGIWVFKSLRLGRADDQSRGAPYISVWGQAALLASAGDLTLEDGADALTAGLGHELSGGGTQDGPAKGCGPGQAGAMGGGGGAFSDGGMAASEGALGGMAASCASYAKLRVLRGGSGGGYGAVGRDNRDTIASTGGAGGGAVQLTALGVLTLNASILADGSSGRRFNEIGGPGGAGSGGGIFLEAPLIRVGRRVVVSAAGGAGTPIFAYDPLRVIGLSGAGGQGWVVIKTMEGGLPPSLRPYPTRGAFSFSYDLGQ